MIKAYIEVLRTPQYIIFIVIHAIFLNASEHTYDEVVHNKKRLEILFSSLYLFYSFITSTLPSGRSS
jgi:hypothetical protein